MLSESKFFTQVSGMCVKQQGTLPASAVIWKVLFVTCLGCWFVNYASSPNASSQI
jgi:hypothetical protein